MMYESWIFRLHTSNLNKIYDYGYFDVSICIVYDVVVVGFDCLHRLMQSTHHFIGYFLFLCTQFCANRCCFPMKDIIN